MISRLAPFKGIPDAISPAVWRCSNQMLHTRLNAAYNVNNCAENHFIEKVGYFKKYLRF
jgi:hypothetical protein